MHTFSESSHTFARVENDARKGTIHDQSFLKPLHMSEIVHADIGARFYLDSDHCAVFPFNEEINFPFLTIPVMPKGLKVIACIYLCRQFIEDEGYNQFAGTIWIKTNSLHIPTQ